MRLVDVGERLRARLDAAPLLVRYAAIALTLAVMACSSLAQVPKEYADLSSLPLPDAARQLHEGYGTDTIADMYESKVILNDLGDMYTKQRLEQTPREAETWSKPASAPYPPVALLGLAGLYAMGQRTGIRFYGMVALLACLFLGFSAWYFLATRWYIFPILYLNFSYLAERFFHVQDGSYLLMLVVLIAALWLARWGRDASHALMAVAITMKLSPIYYARHVLTMRRSSAALFIAIVCAGLLLPFVIWDNYAYIYTFHEELKGGWVQALGAVLIATPFTLLLWYVEARLPFDREDRIGWALVPFGLFIAFKMNVARHLLLVLLVPDKRGGRNIVAATGLALHALAPSLVRFNSTLPIMSVLLVGVLLRYLARIGWDVVRDDLRHPRRTVQMMLHG